MTGHWWLFFLSCALQALGVAVGVFRPRNVPPAQFRRSAAVLFLVGGALFMLVYAFCLRHMLLLAGQPIFTALMLTSLFPRNVKGSGR